MNANELRTGNYILISTLQEDGDFKNELFSVNSTIIRDAEHYGSEWNAEPIPLTEEWLLKFGFEKINHRIDGIIYKKAWLRLTEVLMADWRGGYIGRIECVHQLQNLYFALTGEELTIKNL